MKRNLYHLKRLLSSLPDFTAYYGLVHLRSYQIEAAQAVLDSVLNHRGDTFIWKFARQSGKDETLVALTLYLLMLFSCQDASIVFAAPTFSPQIEIAMQRLADRLSQNLVLKRDGSHRLGYTYRLRRARLTFLSADPAANVVGATAFPLLIINEAQDVLPAIYDKRFAPMVAAHNATRLFSGTAWTRQTLLARQERLCRQDEERDGRRRVFIIDGFDVARVHLPYGRFLESEMARLGPDHPIVISQYLCREIDNQLSMFPPARRALMAGDPSASSPDPTPDGRSPIAFLIDVAGQVTPSTSSFVSSPDARPSTPDGSSIVNQKSEIVNSRDSTTLSIISIDLSTLETLQAPTYRVLQRLQWTGANHLTIFGQLKALAETWRPQHIVIDATGVGEGLWAMLDKAFPTRVIPVKFSASAKSEIGYRFLAIIETGRFRDDCGYDISRSAILTNDPAPSSPELQIVNRKSEIVNSPYAVPGAMNTAGYSPTRAEIDRAYAACQAEILLGPQKTMRWGVPDGTRDEDGGLIHDDIVLADSLTAVLDKLTWSWRYEPFIVRAKDPLDEMSRTRKPTF